MKVGLVSVTYRQLSAQELIALAREAQIEGIEWGSDVHVPPSDLANAEHVRQLSLDAGIEVVSYGSYFRANGEPFAPILDTALALGAPNIRVWAGSLGSKETFPELRCACIAEIRRACEEAMSHALTISVEYHPDTLTDTIGSALQLVREVDHPHLRLYWQPSPDRPHAERLREVEAVLPSLSHLHVFQWTRPAQITYRHPLAEGQLEWPDVLRLAAGERYALLEFVPNDDPQLLRQEALTLQRWLRECQ